MVVPMHVKLDPTKVGGSTQTFEKGLKRLVIGQDEAISQVVNVYQMCEVGLSAPGRPIGSFLFLGPTGTGKTRLVEATAETLLSDPRAVVKIDCAEFQHSHEIAKLIGSPPGYLGHRETHPLLSQERLNQFHTDKLKLSFVLFDEIEKASDSLWNLLLGILDKATLTLGDNRRVDFSRAMIFMTSNLGAQRMIERKMGFASAFTEELIEHKAQQLARIQNIGLTAARSRFSPEFINRIDKIVSFNPLSKEAIASIFHVEMRLLQQRIFNSGRSFVLRCSPQAEEFLIARGFNTEYGARHLKRAIDRELVQPVSNLIATDQVKTGDWIEAHPCGDSLAFFKLGEGLSPVAIADAVGRG